jgi:hypothetical protein
MTEFWTRAWTDSNRDLFERNILTTTDGATGDGAAFREWAEFDTHAQAQTWPTLDEVLRWANQNSAHVGGAGTVAAPPSERYQLALDAAIQRIGDRCHILARPVDANGDVDPDGDPVPVPATVKLAAIMLATRIARRAQTPDGIAGSSEIGGLIRTSSMDPDIEALLAPHIHLGLA